jgi:hypothetical protein
MAPLVMSVQRKPVFVTVPYLHNLSAPPNQWAYFVGGFFAQAYPT